MLVHKSNEVNAKSMGVNKRISGPNTKISLEKKDGTVVKMKVWLNIFQKLKILETIFFLLNNLSSYSKEIAI